MSAFPSSLISVIVDPKDGAIWASGGNSINLKWVFSLMKIPDSRVLISYLVALDIEVLE